MKKLLPLLVILLLTRGTYALVGVGFHWGFDFTMEMNDMTQDYVSYGDTLPVDSVTQNLRSLLLKIDGVDTTQVNTLVDSLQNVTDFANGDLPIYISRTNFERTPLNLGGKILVDALPVEFEVGFNVGTWMYDCMVYLPSGLSGNFSGTYTDIFTYDSVEISPAALGITELADLHSMPFTKVNLDLTVRKSFGGVYLRPHIGAGASLHFATPMVDNQLIADALANAANANGSLTQAVQGDMSGIIEELINDAAKEVKVGMHIQAGLQVNMPVIPLAIYADAKYSFLFEKYYSESAQTSLNGMLINTGIMLYFKTPGQGKE